ncbi:MAG: fumarylacetoacetase [Planctomycetota bacterium]|nr:fumarylacetoacetase [Planctomycetota bacterium]
METSWIESANLPDCDFPLFNLPFCVLETGNSESCIGVAIGNRILNLRRVAESIPLPCSSELQHSTLNRLMQADLEQQNVLRFELIRLLEDKPGRLRDHPELAGQALLDPDHVSFCLPFQIGDFTDFYASLQHATNVGAMFRPDQPLFPNYKSMPIGYHGRASSVMISGTEVIRPTGQVSPEPPSEHASFIKSRRLDYELELGIVIGRGNPAGSPISIEEAPQSIFGYCLLNDWSARDLQKWEYQPLGPFLGKSFATTLSPWVVSQAALEPFRVPPPERNVTDPPLLPYLVGEEDRQKGGIDIHLEVSITSRQMREREMEPLKISDSNFREMYWTVNQMVAHHTSNGCNLRTGDLLGSGTISGTEKISRGCLLERNWDGAFGDPVSGSQRTPLELPTGERRDFLEDGDEIRMSAYCQREGQGRIGFGQCVGRVHP